MTYDVEKLHRLVISCEVDEAHTGSLSAMRNDARDEAQAYRADVQRRTKWARDEPRRGLSLTEMAHLPAHEIDAAGLDMLTLRRGATAEARLAALNDQLTEHAQRVAAQKALVNRLQAWAGGQPGEAVGLTPAGLGVKVHGGQAA